MLTATIRSTSCLLLADWVLACSSPLFVRTVPLDEPVPQSTPQHPTVTPVAPSGQRQSIRRPRVTALALGAAHSCALLDTGALRCWGEGQGRATSPGVRENLGDDEPAASGEPVSVGGNVAVVAAGGAQTCVLLDNGKVRCWGDHVGLTGYAHKYRGRQGWRFWSPAALGDLELQGRAMQIATGETHNCARLEAGSIRCWGDASFGQLGYPSLANVGVFDSPASAGDVPLGSKALRVATGRYRTCVLLENNKMRCFGNDEPRNLLKNRDTRFGLRSAAAGPVLDVGGPVLQLAAGNPTCALLDTGILRCWARNPYSILGYGRSEPPPRLPLPREFRFDEPIRMFATGASRTCVLLEAGQVRCWGAASLGALGYGEGTAIADDRSAENARDLQIGGRAVAIASGDYHACAILETGGVRCWGDNRYGQLGYGHTHTIGDDEVPADAGDVPIVFAATPRHHLTSRDTAADAPATWPADEPTAQETQTCDRPCRGCKPLFEPAWLEKRPRNGWPERLTESERRLLERAYIHYLLSPRCAASQMGAPLTPDLIGTPEDEGRLHDFIRGAFTAPNRQETLIALYVGWCGKVKNIGPSPGNSLVLLVEDDRLLSASLTYPIERLFPTDLEGDGTLEVLSLSHYSINANESRWLTLRSYSGGSESLIGRFDLEEDNHDLRFTDGCRRKWQLYYRAEPNQGARCFTAEAHLSGCRR